MKPYIYSFLLFLLCISGKAQDFYYYKGEKIPLTISTERILVKFSDTKGNTERNQMLLQTDSRILPITDSSYSPHNAAITMPRLLNGSDYNAIKNIVGKLRQQTGVAYASPFYVSNIGKHAPTDEFIVKLASSTSLLQLQDLVKSTGTTLVKQDKYTPSIYYISVNRGTMDALAMANYFFETGLFEFAEPDFFSVTKPLATSVPNDPDFGLQWNVQNTGQTVTNDVPTNVSGTSGADLNVVPAWNITTGRPDIKVAVIDIGVQLDHPDLAVNLLPGYDAVYNAGLASTNLYGGNGPNDCHGTCCAGVIAAVANNGIGIAGIAYNCKIIPVRIYVGDGTGCESNDTYTSASMADGINWAWQIGGADVLSNSWKTTQSSLIDQAITNAVTQGRGGLGSLVLFASGNENNSSIGYPASSTNSMPVGAMSMCNERKYGPGIMEASCKGQVSCDGECWWGSNYGTGLSVVAPGVAITTTDLTGSAGYSGNDYTVNFNGTSSATPGAAGVAALVLSANPCLTATQLRSILEITADKVGNYCYSASTNPWNNEMGHGRLDAYNAVQAAYSATMNSAGNISGSDVGTTSEFQLSIPVNVCAPNIADATYFVVRHQVNATITYPYTAAPLIYATSNGWSAANPNSTSNWAGASNVTPTSATLTAYAYDAYDILGRDLGYISPSPSQIRFYYTVLSGYGTDEYFQDETVTDTETQFALDGIWAGSDVTSSVPVGNYEVASGANITFEAAHTISIQPGFIVDPGAYFTAKIVPAETCSQYPNGRVANVSTVNTSLSSTVFVNSEISAPASSNETTIFPNPTSSNINLYLDYDDSKFIEVSVINSLGEQMFSKELQGTEKRLSIYLGDAPSGLYLVGVKCDGQIKYTKVIVSE